MSHANGGPAADFFDVRVLRQAAPAERSYWERFRVQREPDMNVISVLQRIAARPHTVDGRDVTPVAWDCNCLEEVCGACTMVINGRVRQSCSALVHRLLAENPGEIELRPMTRFPVIRDLVVDRSRLFRGLTKIKAWVPVDGYHEMGAGPRQSTAQQEAAYPYSQCMSCGCCLDACPQYGKVELFRQEGESEAEFRNREREAFDRAFIGANALGQAVLFDEHPVAGTMADERLDALMGPGGIQDCGNAQNCVAVCPKLIPLTTAIGQIGRATTWRAIKRWFDR